jgi:hypothetical protein
MAAAQKDYVARLLLAAALLFMAAFKVTREITS